jgi:ubiquinone/menaquinone biosynthesis C-methylase UbiE
VYKRQGNTTLPWTKIRRCKVIGVDASSAMLKEAKKKSKRIKWYKQDLKNLKIKEKADVVTCHFGAINHFLRKKDLQKVFKNVSKILKRGALFQFDLNTEQWFKYLSAHEKYFKIDKHYFISKNEYDSRNKIITFNQLWFMKKRRLYEKREVEIRERAYTKTEIECLLKKAGLKLLSAVPLGDLKGKPLYILYLARKAE